MLDFKGDHYSNYLFYPDTIDVKANVMLYIKTFSSGYIDQSLFIVGAIKL